MTANWKKEIVGAGWLIGGPIAGMVTYLIAPEHLTIDKENLNDLINSRYHLPVVYAVSLVVAIFSEGVQVIKKGLVVLATLALVWSFFVGMISALTLLFLIPD
jgi:hypothetical protein